MTREVWDRLPRTSPATCTPMNLGLWIEGSTSLVGWGWVPGKPWDYKSNRGVHNAKIAGAPGLVPGVSRNSTCSGGLGATNSRSKNVRVLDGAAPAPIAPRQRADRLSC